MKIHDYDSQKMPDRNVTSMNVVCEGTHKHTFDL